MPKRSSKGIRDVNRVALFVVEQATAEGEGRTREATGPDAPDTSGKNPAAVALGRLGGLKGGAARAKALSAKKRSEIAKKAAISRWKNFRGK